MEERERALIDAVFGDGPKRPAMPPAQTIREWRESTEDAIKALTSWLYSLQEWERAGGEVGPGDFDAAYRALYAAGLEGWADGNPTGGGLDALAEAVTANSGKWTIPPGKGHFLTVAEVAERFDVAPVTARAWCERGLFPNARQAGRTGTGAIWLVPEADLTGFERPKMGYPAGRPRKPAAGDVAQEGGE